jgi:hypothetical protein
VVGDILKECVNMDLELFKMEVTVSFKMSRTTDPVMQCHITDDTYSNIAQEIQLSIHMK